MNVSALSALRSETHARLATPSSQGGGSGAGPGKGLRFAMQTGAVSLSDWQGEKHGAPGALDSLPEFEPA